MNPTQIELATLAATLAGTATPADRVDAAMSLWKAAGDALQAADKLAATMADRERDIAETRALFNGRKTIPFDEFLAYLMPPPERPERRAARYENYLRSNIIFCDEQTGRIRTTAEVESAARKTLIADMQAEVTRHNFMNRVREVLRVLKSDKRQVLTERAKKGKAAQKKKSLVPATKKAPRKK